MTTLTVNEPLIRDIVAQIEKDETRWDQRYWAGEDGCGTSFCFAGWAAMLGGMFEQRESALVVTEAGLDEGLEAWNHQITRESAVNWWSKMNLYPFEAVSAKLLGLTRGQAETLFNAGSRLAGPFLTFEEFKALITDVTGVVFDEPSTPEPIEPPAEAPIVLLSEPRVLVAA